MEEDKIFNLDIKNRIVLLGILPKQADYVTMRLIINLKKNLDLSVEEIKEYEIRPGEKGGLMWNAKKEKVKEISIQNMVSKIISRELKDLDKKKKLQEDTLELYDLFVEKND